ncbi:MAG: class I SAM-dependent methyltransferase [Planctomycetota bacterium]
MAEDKRSDIFDRWAENYDESVRGSTSFPFDGYDDVLDEVIRRAGVLEKRRVLDLGSGTGNLTERIVSAGGEAWALDFSEKMLARARRRLPDARFFQGDVLADLPPLLKVPFDAVLSTYVFHEFPLMTKVSLLGRIAAEHLAPGGRIVIGDVSFATTAERERVLAEQADMADDDEEYWAATVAVPALESAGFRVDYTQVSSCGGVYVVHPNR